MESNCSTNTSTAFAAAASGAAAPATGLVALYAVAEAAGARRPPRAPTALSLSRVRGRTGKTKVKMSASTKQNSDKHVYGAQATGVHQAFTNGYQRGSISLTNAICDCQAAFLKLHEIANKARQHFDQVGLQGTVREELDEAEKDKLI